MNTQLILNFLCDLRDNNSCEWMNGNKTYYLEAKNEFEDLLRRLIQEVSIFDLGIRHLQPRDIIYRMNRDTRFSKDKSPYSPSFRANLSPGGKTPVPVGYFIYIIPNGSMLGGGLFTPNLPTATKKVRDYLAANGEEFIQIITSPTFAKQFTIEGDKLKNVPKGYDAALPAAEYIKHKAWDAGYAISDEMFKDHRTIVHCMTEICRAIKPFNDYINRALEGYVMPTM